MQTEWDQLRHRSEDETITLPRWYARAVPSALALSLLLLVALTCTNTMGFLSTDVGGKVATLEAMKRNGTLSPDLGYWAVAADPDGSLYPMWSTSQVDSSWINVTTLPMLLIALPLYKVGGAFAAGLVPLAGTVLAAFAARTLGRRLGSDGTAAFWIVGAASPLTIYALDFWEHSLGVALVVWAVVWVLDASRDGGSWRTALAAGACFGLAASMRQEALVYGFVSGCGLGIRLLTSGSQVAATVRGGALSVGFVFAWFINSVLESSIIGDSTRLDRSTGTAVRIFSDGLLRLEEALITVGSPFARTGALFLALAAITVMVLVELGRRVDTTEPLRPIVTAGAIIGMLWLVNLFVSGLGFVPGLAATTPVALLSLTRTWGTADRRLVGGIAVGALPLIWAVQYTGGAIPQWGGRYLLASGTLLVVLTTVVLTSAAGKQLLRSAALVGFIVTLVGVLWTVERTHGFANAMQILADRDEPALVFADPFLSREGGILVLDERWLAVTDSADRSEAADVLLELGIREIGFVQPFRGEDVVALPGWKIVAAERIPLLDGVDLQVTTQVPAED